MKIEIYRFCDVYSDFVLSEQSEHTQNIKFYFSIKIKSYFTKM